MKILEYPANREAFEKLIPFAQQILTLCTDNKINPVLYGSFAVFYHTNNKGIEINDIDILIPKADFPRVVELLERARLEFKYIEAYPDNGMSTITVRENNLQVELDEVGSDYATITEENILRSAQQINFYGLSSRIVTHAQITDIYRTAYNRADNDKAKLLTRLKLLESDPSLDTPDPTHTQLKALLLQHSDKRVCVVGTTCTGKSTLLAQIPGARDQDGEIFPKLSAEEKTYVCQTSMD